MQSGSLFEIEGLDESDCMSRADRQAPDWLALVARMEAVRAAAAAWWSGERAAQVPGNSSTCSPSDATAPLPQLRAMLRQHLQQRQRRLIRASHEQRYLPGRSERHANAADTRRSLTRLRE